MWERIKKLRQQRANLIHQARDILDLAEKEARELTADEEKRWNDLHEEANQLKTEYERLEQQADSERDLERSQGRAGGHQDGPPQDASDSSDLLNGDAGDGQRTQDRAEQHREAFFRWCQRGMSGLSPEQRQVMTAVRQELPSEARAQAAGIDTLGGYLAPAEFVNQLERAMLPFAGIRNTRAKIRRTTNGNDMFWPTANNTSKKGERLGENQPASEEDLTVGGITLRAYIYSSKIIRAPLTFLEDAQIADVEGFITDEAAERIGRKFGEDTIVGTGNNMPHGLAEATVEGHQGASQSAITYDDLVEMEFSVNSSYRRQAEWLLGDGALKQLKRLRDGEGRPLWVPGAAVREPDTINGYRYTIDEEIPDPAQGAITLYFGDFSKFIIRDVRQVVVLRLVERYAEFLQVGFLAFSRHDANLLDAGTHPIKHFRQAA